MQEDKQENTDIFLWANRTDSVKNDIDIELFLFNRYYTPFSMRFASELEAQIRALFLYDVIGAVNFGAGTGLSVRVFEESEAEENVLLRAERTNVVKADALINTINKSRAEIVEFNQEEHDFKRMKGIIARFSTKAEPTNAFYIAKSIQTGAALTDITAWEINGARFDRFKADVGLKIPHDNQVLIIDQDIFVFSQSKFERLFEYDYKKQAIADKKVEEIEQKYKLSFPDGLDLQALIKDRKKTVNKLQKLEIGEIAQDKVLEYADDMQLELMTDDAGAIIIMDGNDLDTFVNLINEDYITSEITGKRYEIKSKKLLDEPSGGEPPRG
jgi:hypothetical protein